MTSNETSDAAPTPEERVRLRSMLARPLPEIPPVYFYDDRGSDLFEAITGLPEYYQTRAEIGILKRHAGEIMAAAAPRRVVELGSGAGRKIRLLLDAWGRREGGRCTMLDVNATFLDRSVARLRSAYPGLGVDGVVGDFTRDLDRLGAGGGRLTVFFGGTIGNLYPDERRAFFEGLAGGMAPDDALLLGVDLVKERARLEAAYNDGAGLTAEFNRQALRTLNQRFGADFVPEAFEHVAFYDAENAWIEMRLRARSRQVVRIPGIDLRLELAAGAEIRTEVSCKFTRSSVAAAAAGLVIDGWYGDRGGLFALALLRPAAAG